ncbi:MAG TPA: PGDYG domain-containing protein [Steroidobacteraceae bacterium]
MNRNAPLVFHSSGRTGFSNAVDGNPRRVGARKLAKEIQVRFASSDSPVHTAEGVVHAKPGDAIITGTSGEHWRVSSAHFPSKYEPVPPTRCGDPGTYRSKRYRILALPMEQPFEVILADGVSRLSGRPGDWLVDYGDGSLGIVSPAIFATTYEIVD